MPWPAHKVVGHVITKEALSPGGLNANALPLLYTQYLRTVCAKVSTPRRLDPSCLVEVNN